MKGLLGSCIDCGSKAETLFVDEVKPVYKMELVKYECGARLTTYFTANGNVGRVIQSGCMREEAVPATI